MLAPWLTQLPWLIHAGPPWPPVALQKTLASEAWQMDPLRANLPRKCENRSWVTTILMLDNVAPYGGRIADFMGSKFFLNMRLAGLMTWVILQFHVVNPMRSTTLMISFQPFQPRTNQFDQNHLRPHLFWGGGSGLGLVPTTLCSETWTSNP